MLDIEEIKKIEQNLNLQFSDKNRLSIAFCHKSYLNSINVSSDTLLHYEWIGSIGRDLYKLVIVDLGFSLITQEPNTMTLIRKEIDDQSIKEKIVMQYKLIDYFKFGRAQINRDELIRSLFDTLLAVIYIEYGYNKVIDIIKPIYNCEIKLLLQKPIKDCKSALQEYIQEKKGTVTYKLIEELGPAHDKIFTVEVYALNKKAQGTGRSKKNAEKEAALSYYKEHIPRRNWNIYFSNLNIDIYKIPRMSLKQKRITELERLSDLFPAHLVLIHQGLTHKSYTHNNIDKATISNDLLANLGSAAQSFIYTVYLYNNRSQLNLYSDDLSHFIGLKSYLTSHNLNASIYDKLNLDELLLVGKTHDNINVSVAMKSDVIKALFSAVFISQKYIHNKNFYSCMHNFINKYIANECLNFKRDEFDPKSKLQELAQDLLWEVTYKKITIVQSHESWYKSIVSIRIDSQTQYEWAAEGGSVTQATAIAAREALHELQDILNFNNDISIESRIKFRVLIRDYLEKIGSVSIKYIKANKLLEASGGLGLIELINNNFNHAYMKLTRTYYLMEQLSIELEQYAIFILKKIEPFYKTQQFQVVNIGAYLTELLAWLNKISPSTRKEELEPYLNELVDSIQVFRIVLQEPFNTISLNDIVDDVLLIKPRNIEILPLELNQIYLIFGQKPYLSWAFYYILSKLQDYRANYERKLRVGISIHSMTNDGVTVLEFKYNKNDINHEHLIIINDVLSLIVLCFAQVELIDGIIRIKFFNPLIQNTQYTQSASERVVHIFQHMHNKQLQVINEQSPISGIMHDLKNALINLKRNLQSKSDYTVELLRSRDTCYKIATSLMSFFNLNKPNYDSVYIYELCASISREIKTLAGDKCKTNLAVNIIKDEVNTDSTMVHSIIINLVKNSIESIQESGQVYVFINIEDNDSMEIIVQDNGCGIEKDRIKNIFTSFNTTKSKNGGTGLGLPTIKRLTNLLGGVIEVDSEIGIGTKFVVTIPI